MHSSFGLASLNAQPVSADLIPELQRLGQRLEQARESQGLSREQQAERLRMGTEQLRALEQGDRADLPEAVFVVAQARRVAASLGVNIDAEISALRGNAAFQASPSRPPQAAASTGNPSTGGGSELVLRALQPSWLEVRSAQGDVLFRGTLQGERRFPLNRELRVLAGRPDLVTASAPGQRGQVLGPIEAVRWQSFRPSVPQAPAP
jgi:cytoskeletal protein RodZ